jgi:CRISPR system Cascade subunit CasA
MARNVQWCVKVALFDKPKDVKGDTSVISARLYQATEEDFYRLLDRAATTYSNEEVTEIRREWYKLLGDVADRLFDDYSQINEIDEIDAQRAVNARRLLRNPFSKSNKKIRGHLGIPDPGSRKTVRKK